MSIFVLPKTHTTKKHDKEWLLSAAPLNTTFVYCPSCYIILPCVYTKNHEKKFKQRTVVIRCNSYRLLHSDSYTTLTWCYINWCIDTQETHRIYFHKIFGLFFFYFFWTWAEDYVSTLIFFDPDSFVSGKVIWRTVLPDVNMKWCKCLKKICHVN